MSKQEQILILDPPSELKFKGPFSEVVTSELKLTNPSAKRVLFKVKTTAPKCYCVRPNSGLIEPGSYVTVSVMLQPFDHNSSEKNKHKFMVQSMFTPDDASVESHDLLWKEASPTQLMDSKLRCSFIGADNVPSVNIGRDEEPVKPVYNKDLTSTAGIEKLPLTAFNKASDSFDLQQLNEQCRRLNLDIQHLKEENEKLRNEGLRLRRAALSDTVSATPPPATTSNVKFPSAFDTQPSSFPPVLYLIIALIVGLLIGKLLL